jgi:hypothetical protein
MYDFPGLAEPRESEPCPDCGVIYGNVHHVGCSWEKCPVDEGQFLGCGHDEDAKYLKEPSFKEYAYRPGLLKQLQGQGQVKHRSVARS